jgi:Cobalamin-independent synthase, N-terminal domain
MVLATNLGFPRLGAQRELKWAIERCWSGKSSQAEVEKTLVNCARGIGSYRAIWAWITFPAPISRSMTTFWT